MAIRKFINSGNQRFFYASAIEILCVNRDGKEDRPHRLNPLKIGQDKLSQIR